MKKILVLIFVIFSNHVNAACWKEISASNNATISIDDCSIAKDGIYRKAWFKWEYNTLQETKDYPTKKYIKTLELDYFNCSARKSAAIKGIYYGENGDVVESESVQLNRVAFDEAPPETIGETLMNYMCKKKN